MCAVLSVDVAEFNTSTSAHGLRAASLLSPKVLCSAILFGFAVFQPFGSNVGLVRSLGCMVVRFPALWVD
jgi:hypothetical protein